MKNQQTNKLHMCIINIANMQKIYALGKLHFSKFAIKYKATQTSSVANIRTS